MNLPGLDQHILSGYYWFLKLHQDKTELNETHWDLRATLLPLLPILFVLTHNAVQLSVVTLSHALSLSETDSTLSETNSFLISSLDKSTFERDSTPVMEGERKRKRLFHGNKCRITCKKIISFIPVHVSLGCLWNCAHFPLVLCFASGCRPIMYAKLCICINKISFLQVSLYVSGRNLLVKLVMTFLFCVAEKKQNTVSPQPQCRQCLKFDRSLQGQQLTNKTSRRYKDFKVGATRDGVNYLMSQST